jgi:tetratricopeptide (TPR) repeat protein
LAIFGVAALLVASFAFYVTGGNFLDIVNYPYTYRTFTMWQRLITEPIILLRYLFLLLYPSADFLIFDPDIQASVGLLQPPVTILGDFLVILLFIFSLMNLRRFPILCFAIFYFFVNHAIESSFIGLELYFEHRNYLPSVFVYFALSYYFVKLIEFYKHRNRSYVQILLCVAMTFVLTGEANATFLRNDIWKTSVSLLKDNIEKAPLNMRSWFTLGAIHIREKKFKEAGYYLSQAEMLYEIYPNRYQDNWVSLLYYNFGILELHTNNTDNAIKYLNKSIGINPDAIKWSSHFNLGVLYFNDGQFENSEESLRNALKRGKNLPDIYNVLGRVLYENNKVDEAIEILEKGLSVKYMPELTLNLIAAYIKKGNLQKAKQVLFSMPYHKNDLEYLLYRAHLYTGEDRDKSLNAVAAKFVLIKSDIYAWIEEITSNKFAAIIYPDMQELHEPLVYKYKEMVVKDIASKINAIDNMSCQK